MLTQETLLQLLKCNFDPLARKGLRVLRSQRYIALAHIEGAKDPVETAPA